MTRRTEHRQHPAITVFSCGCLMALGWAINGMIGHAPGSSVPGVFIALAVAGILGLTREPADVHTLMRLAAFGAMGYWYGGEMTYGQTFQLTKWDAAGGAYYWWGMLGVAVKGAAWSGIGAAFIGFGLNWKRYRWQEVSLLLLAMTVASFLGLFLFNRPNFLSGDLPLIRFSFNPNDPSLPGRTECWAAIWAGMVVLLIYAKAIKKDVLTFRFGMAGILGGGIGFSVGQMIQSYSWAHPEMRLEPWIDWWKVMEMTHGFIVGVFISLAALRTRPEEIPAGEPIGQALSPKAEWIGIIIWLWIVAGYFFPYPTTFVLDYPMGVFLAVFPFIFGVLVFAGLTAGRWWPWIIVGLQTPLETCLFTATEAKHTYTADTGWGTPDGSVISLFEVLTYAWPMLIIGIVVCAVPMWRWLYSQAPRQGTGWSIIRLFIGFHVIAVFIQMLWTILNFAASWNLKDLFLYGRPLYTLMTVYLVCWIIAMVWFPIEED
ncbi:MAG TPA: hypothetical protein PLG59_05595 [bacterium]|nr:hypothetical protein [bacterium]HQP98420.1 hypothetical protein [bacterium]